MPVDPSLLDKDLATIRAKRGDNAARMGNQTLAVERIPVFSPTIMRITDGGIPIGRITRFYGDPSTGKTHLVYLVIAAAQQLKSKRFPKGLQCTYWNVEGIYDALHAKHLGVDTVKLAIEETKVIEDIAVEMELLLRSSHLHAVDSMSSAKARDELAADGDQWLPMIKAKAWQRALDRIEARMDGNENAIIMVSHVGEKVDMKRRTSHRYAKGGKAIHYASSMDLEFSAGAWLYYHPDGHLEKDDKIKEEAGMSFTGMKEPDGIEIAVRCKKNRTGRQFRSGKMRLDLNSFEFDTTFELLDAATYFDHDGHPAHDSGNEPIIRRTGERSSWYLLPDGTKVQGQNGIRAELSKNDELVQVVRGAMLAGY